MMIDLRSGADVIWLSIDVKVLGSNPGGERLYSRII